MIRTYVDYSGVLIEAYRGSSLLAAPAVAILGDANRQFVTSAFVRLEVLPKPTYYKRLIEVAFYSAFFAAARRSVPITKALVQLAMRRAETFGLSAVDALHIAAAETGHANEFITSERPSSPLSLVTTLHVMSLHP